MTAAAKAAEITTAPGSGRCLQMTGFDTFLQTKEAPLLAAAALLSLLLVYYSAIGHRILSVTTMQRFAQIIYNPHRKNCLVACLVYISVVYGDRDIFGLYLRDIIAIGLICISGSLTTAMIASLVSALKELLIPLLQSPFKELLSFLPKLITPMDGDKTLLDAYKSNTTSKIMEAALMVEVAKLDAYRMAICLVVAFLFVVTTLVAFFALRALWFSGGRDIVSSFVKSKHGPQDSRRPAVQEQEQ